MSESTNPSDRSTTPADLVISNATVLVHSDNGSIDFVTDHDIVIRDGVIESVVSHGAPIPAAETINGHGKVAMPGLINCHSHSPMVMFRGAAEDVPDTVWFNEYIWPMEVNLTEEDVELAARLAAAEMIRSGTTTFVDHYFSMDAIARVAKDTGMRGLLGWTYFSSEGPAGFERSLSFAQEWDGAAGGRIRTALAPHAPYTVTDDDLVVTATAAREHGLPVHIHASEARSQMRNSLERNGVTPIEVLRRTGILEAHTIIAHGVGIVADDLPALAAAPMVGVASAPKGYLKHGFDTTPVRLLRSAGVPVGLATDGAASNNTVDIWESMTAMGLVQKATERDQAYLPARDVLGMATTASAAVAGLTGIVGRIAPGYRADLILVDLSGPRTQPIHDLASTLVYSAHSDDIDTTIVDGKVLMRDKKLMTVDVAAVVAELAPRLARLTDRSHGKTIQEYGE